MPEALIVLFVFFVSMIVWVAAWIRSRDPSLRNATEDVHRLRHQEAWLSQRLQVAETERWGAEMVAGIAAELHLTKQELARAGQREGR